MYSRDSNPVRTFPHKLPTPFKREGGVKLLPVLIFRFELDHRVALAAPTSLPFLGINPVEPSNLLVHVTPFAREHIVCTIFLTTHGLKKMISDFTPKVRSFFVTTYKQFIKKC